MQKKNKKLPLFVRKPFLVVYFAFTLSCVTALSIFATAHPADASTPTLNFQARLLGSSGAIVPDGYYNVEFEIYSGSSCNPSNGTGCTSDWTENYYGGSTDNRLRVQDGYITANLGSLTPFNSSIPWGQPLWLSINIGGTTNTSSPTLDGAMFPYLTLTSVPAAMSLNYTDGTHTGTLSFSGALSGNDSITLPDASGTVCLTAGNCSTAGSGYLLNQSSYTGSAQTGNFNITGTGVASSLLVSTSGDLDVASAGVLSLGVTTATGITLGSTSEPGTITVGQSTTTNTINIGNAATTNAQTINLGTGATGTGSDVITIGSTNGSSSTTIQGGTGSSAISLAPGTNGSIVETATGTGTITLQSAVGSGGGTGVTIKSTNSSDNQNAFQVVDHNGTYILNVDTQNDVVNLGALKVGTFNTTSGYLDTLNSGATVAIGNTNASAVTIGKTSANTTTTINGTATIKPTSGNDTTTAFQVQNAAGADMFRIDTSSTTNLVTNPSFEAGLTGWSGKGTGTITSDTTQAYSDLTSGKIATTSSAAANDGAKYTYTLVANTTYNLSFYAKLASGSMTTLAAGRNDNGADIPCTLNSSTLSASSWTRFNCSFTTGSTISNSYVFIGQSDASVAHTFYIDGVQLTSGSAALLALDNGGRISLPSTINSPIVFQNSSNSTTAFQIQNAAGTSNLLVADTANSAIGINGASTTAGYALNVTGSVNASTGLFDNGNRVCSSSSTSCTLQTAYNNSTSSPAIKLNGTNGAFTLQDADSSLGGGVNFMTFNSSSATPGGVVAVFGFGITGSFVMQPTNASSSAMRLYVSGSTTKYIFSIDDTPSAPVVNLGTNQTSTSGISGTVVNINTANQANTTTTIGSTALSGSGTTTVNIGYTNTSNGTSNVNIGSGPLATLAGGGNTLVQANQALTLNGSSSVAINSSINGNTTINGGSSTGTVGIGNSSAGALTLQSGSTIGVTTTNFSLSTAGVVTLKGGNAAGDIVTAPATTANAITIEAGASSGASSNGGSVTIQGGAASGTTSVTGGSVTIQGGNATGASGTRNGGNASIDAGTGATTNGTVSLGDVNAATINVGTNSTQATSINIGSNSTSNVASINLKSAGTINIGAANVAKTINLGTGSTSTQTQVTVGSTGSNSSLTLQAGTGNLLLSTGSGAGNINLLTGNASSSVTVKNTANSTTAFQVQNGTPASIFTVDTTTDSSNDLGQIIVGAGSVGETSGTKPVLLTTDSSNTEPTTAVNGAIYYNTTMNAFRCGENGVWRSCIGGLVNSSTAPTSAISNTVTETNFGGGTNNSYGVPANDCQTGVTYTVTASGVYSTTGTPTLQLFLNEDGTSTALSSTSAITTPSNASNLGWRLSAQMICISTTSVEVQGSVTIGNATTNLATSAIVALMQNSSTLTWSTSAHTLYIGATWGTADPSNTITMRQFIVQRLGP